MDMKKHPLLGKKIRIKSIPGVIEKDYPLKKDFITTIVGVKEKDPNNVRYAIRCQDELFEGKAQPALGWKRKESEDSFVWDEAHGPEDLTVYVTAQAVEFIN